MDLKKILDEVVNAVLVEDGLSMAVLDDKTRLGDIGLDSLGFAIVIARLEKLIGYDPFTEGEISEYPSTFGEFVKIYQDFS